MCHDIHLTTERLRDDVAEELLAKPAPADDPEFLNDERDTEVELLTDGGA